MTQIFVAVYCSDPRFRKPGIRIGAGTIEILVQIGMGLTGLIKMYVFSYFDCLSILFYFIEVS